ncbi:MAG TPA: EFR1 family ferrodoxin [Firmicutes bacterium]|nr:EFR1 family ferrodoxin [Bacillota bacterium]
MVFYFTGTGNSLYIAKQITENPVSIPQVMQQTHMEFTADSIGIVAPVYGHEVPLMVKDFLKQAVFHTDYFYMILTYGNRHGGAAELAKQLCDACGIAVHYINMILMADNWLPGFDMEEQKKLDKNVEGQLAEILADLNVHQRMIANVTETDRASHRQFLDRMSRIPADAWQHLIWMTDRCTGCGICQKVCPSASIRLLEGKTVHIPGYCQTCLACVHACPSKAIGLTVPEKNPKARYRNAHISLQEIMQANCQVSRI